MVDAGIGRRVSDILSPLRGGGKTAEQALDLQVLLARALGEERTYLYAHPERELSEREYALFERFVQRRRAGEPIAYITGEKEFYSLSFKVDRSVLIPRPETELLVDESLARSPARLLDMGTGAGNVAIAVKFHLPSCFVVACDISPAALALAEENARSILGENDILFVESRFYEGLRRGLPLSSGLSAGNEAFPPRRPPPRRAPRFDLIVSNPPYVKRSALADLQREIREYEPSIALDGGEDGLDAYRSILGGAREFLAPGGRIVLETDPDVVSGLLVIAEEAGFRIEKTARDLRGLERMVIAA